MLNLLKLTADYLIAYYQFPPKLAERYAVILLSRWTIDGLENNLDAATINVDCYQESDDWETSDYMSENIKNLVNEKLPFPNLDYEEKNIAKQIEEMVKEIKMA